MKKNQEHVAVLKTSTFDQNSLAEITTAHLDEINETLIKYRGKSKDLSLVLLFPFAYDKMKSDLTSLTQPCYQNSIDLSNKNPSRLFISFWQKGDDERKVKTVFTDRFAENINDKIRESGNFTAKMLKSAMRELLDWNAYNPESTIKRILFTHDTNQPINESISQVSESFGGSTFSYEDLRFQCLGLLETAYPNSISFDYMLTIFGMNRDFLHQTIAKLQFEGYITETQNQVYVRKIAGEEILDLSDKSQLEETAQQTNDNNYPQRVGSKKFIGFPDPEIGIIVSSYSQKLSIDAFLKNKTTFRHRCDTQPKTVSSNLSQQSSPKSNVYTAGIWQNESIRIPVVCLKLPGSLDNSEKSEIASGGLVTRLFGRFPKVKKAIVITNLSIPPKNLHDTGVEIGDVLCSKSSGDKDFSLVHYEGGKKNNRSKLKSLGMEQEAQLNTSLNVLQKSLLDEPRLLKKYLKAGMRYLENQNLNSSVKGILDKESQKIKFKTGCIANVKYGTFNESIAENMKNDQILAFDEKLLPILRSIEGNGIEKYVVIGYVDKTYSKTITRSNSISKMTQNSLLSSMKCAAIAFRMINDGF